MGMSDKAKDALQPDAQKVPFTRILGAPISIISTDSVLPLFEAWMADRCDRFVVLYQLALPATHVRRCPGFVAPIQAFDSTRIYDAIIPA
jgi:hypothetical protein